MNFYQIVIIKQFLNCPLSESLSQQGYKGITSSRFLRKSRKNIQNPKNRQYQISKIIWQFGHIPEWLKKSIKSDSKLAWSHISPNLPTSRIHTFMIPLFFAFITLCTIQAWKPTKHTPKNLCHSKKCYCKDMKKKMTQTESKWAVHYLGCASVWQSIVTSVPLGAPTSWLGTIKREYLYYIDTHTHKKE